jgi:dolichol-phosphate mannosyltransferase
MADDAASTSRRRKPAAAELPPSAAVTIHPVSVIVPTFREEKNIEPLTRRLFAATRAASIPIELVFIDDDSGQGTVETVGIVAKLHKEGFDVRVRVRRPSEGRGLSSAVLLGLQKEAKHDVLLVMDADLQHEPEAVPAVLAPVLKGDADFSVGSRNVGGGLVEDWPLIRRVISWGATALARPLTTCSDPMSGFFALPRSTLKRGKRLNPTGYKIGLELMVRCRCTDIAEVPIRFRDREQGESKLTMKQNLLYLAHLARLYWFAYPWLVVLVLLLLVLAASACVALAYMVLLHRVPAR